MSDVASGQYTQREAGYSLYSSTHMNPTKSSMNKVVKASRNAKRDRNISEPPGGGFMPPVQYRAPAQNMQTLAMMENGDEERLSSAMGPPLPQLKTIRLKSRNKANTSHNVSSIKQQTAALKQHIITDNDVKVRSCHGATSSVPSSTRTSILNKT